MARYKKVDGKSVEFQEFSNSEVIEYLAATFNTITPRFMVLSRSLFNNSLIAKFDDVSFLLNAAGTCIEIGFAKVDSDKMEPIVEAFKKWDKFSEDCKPFYVKVDKDIARSLLFESGYQSRGAFRRRLETYDCEIIELTTRKGRRNIFLSN